MIKADNEMSRGIITELVRVLITRQEKSYLHEIDLEITYKENYIGKDYNDFWKYSHYHHYLDDLII